MYSTLIVRTAAIVTGAFALFGLLIAVGQIDPDGNANAFERLGISMSIFTALVVIVFVIIAIPFWFIQRRRNSAASTLRQAAGSVAGAFIACVWLLNVMLLIMVLFATVIATTQIAFVGFVFGSPSERHSYLIAITITITILLGLGTVARGVWGRRLAWRDAIGHGFQSAVVCSILVYAGLVLAVFPWDWLSDDPEYVRNNPWTIAVALVEFLIIIVGTSALMSKQVQAWPAERQHIGRCLHGSRFSMGIKDIVLRWRRIKSRLLRRRRYTDWPIFP